MWREISLSFSRSVSVLTQSLGDYWVYWLAAAVGVAAYVSITAKRRASKIGAHRPDGTIAVEEHHEFVVLIQAARNDTEFRREVLDVLRLEPFHRRSYLGGFVAEMQLKGAPAEVVEAVGLLRDNHVAERAIMLLEEIDRE